MPIYSQTSADERGVPNPRWLARRGPLLKVRIQAHSDIGLVEEGDPEFAQKAKEGLALVDTGASSSAVDDSVIRGLGVAPVGVTYAGTAGGARPFNQFPATLGFQQLGLTLVFDRVVGCHIASQGIIALIGRDVLSRMLFVYDGPVGHTSLGH